MAKEELDSSNKTAGLSEITRFDIVDAVVRVESPSLESTPTVLNPHRSWRR